MIFIIVPLSACLTKEALVMTQRHLCFNRTDGFNTNGNRGIACGLNNIQKIRDGEPLGGHLSAEAEFAGLGDGEDEDFLS